METKLWMESTQLPLTDCFKLGRALRVDDVETFFQIYDSLMFAEKSGRSREDISQLELTSIKEAARQISDLDADDYAILARVTAPDQYCSMSLDIFEPIAIQLSQLIHQCRLDDQSTWTSDSGAVSDYDSSACDIAESAKGDSSQRFDYNVLVKSEKYTESEQKEALTPESNNTSSLEEVSEAASFQVKAIDSGPQSTTANDEMDMLGGLLQKVKDPDTACVTDSVLLLEDQEPEATKLSQNEAIMVADLEKSFFSSKIEYTTQPEESAPQGQSDQEVHLNICRRKAQLTQPRTADYNSRRRGHWQGRGGRGRGRRQRSVSYSGSENTCYRSAYYSHKHLDYFQSTHTAEAQNPRHNRGRYGSDQGREHRVRSRDGRSKEHFAEPHQLQSEPKTVSLYKQMSSNSNNSGKNRADDAGSWSDRKHTKLNFTATFPHQQEQLHLQQPSPLVVHRQNMWPANQVIIKSAKKNTNDYHPHHTPRVKDSAFNHYEVGCFLLEGWENVQHTFQHCHC